MRTTVLPQPQSAPLQPRRERAAAVRMAKNSGFRRQLPLRFFTLIAAAGICVAPPALLSASVPAPQNPDAPSTSAQKPAHHHKRTGPAHPEVTPVPEAPAPVSPPVPETPKWPAFENAAPATVTWDGHGLSIDAANSSLQQILKDVSSATGSKVEGMAADQRVFGTYGPGQPRDVLSQLLQGSGYNVIMIGDQGHGAPRQILLSLRQAGPAQPVARNNQPTSTEDDSEPEEQPEQPESQPVRPGFPPGAPPRSPQQIMQEMQQRQQQMQPQQQPVNPQN